MVLRNRKHLLDPGVHRCEYVQGLQRVTSSWSQVAEFLTHPRSQQALFIELIWKGFFIMGHIFKTIPICNVNFITSSYIPSTSPPGMFVCLVSISEITPPSNFFPQLPCSPLFILIFFFVYLTQYSPCPWGHVHWLHHLIHFCSILRPLCEMPLLSFALRELLPKL